MSAIPDQELQRYRGLLHILARQLQLNPRFQRRFDSSDLVQEALFRAHRDQAQFRGQTESELLKWLHTILLHTANDKMREARAQKRDVALEHSLEALAADSSARLEKYLADGDLTPQTRAARHERLLRVSAAIDQLPEDQRDAVILRDLEELPIEEVAARMGRTAKSVGGLLRRGREALRQRLADMG